MVILKDSIEIRAKPDKIFHWLKNLDKNYKEWHPDHVKCVNLMDSEELQIEDVFLYEEYLHGELHKLKFKLTKIEENTRIEFKSLFPISLICPGGSFIIEPKGENSIFIATLSFRLGKLFSKFAKSKVDAIKQHMKEEGENLKKLLEKD